MTMTTFRKNKTLEALNKLSLVRARDERTTKLISTMSALSTPKDARAWKEYWAEEDKEFTEFMNQAYSIK